MDTLPGLDLGRGPFPPPNWMLWLFVQIVLTISGFVMNTDYPVHPLIMVVAAITFLYVICLSIALVLERDVLIPHKAFSVILVLICIWQLQTSVRSLSAFSGSTL